MARPDGNGARARPLRSDESLYANLPRAAARAAREPARRFRGRPAGRNHGSATLDRPETVVALPAWFADSITVTVAAAARRLAPGCMGVGRHRPARNVAIARSVALRMAARSRSACRWPVA